MTKQARRSLLTVCIILVILLSGFLIAKNKISEQILQKGIRAMEQKDYISAIRNFNKAVRLNRKSAPAHLNLGKALYYHEDFPAALENLNFAPHVQY